jgi:hypothetical protein
MRALAIARASAVHQRGKKSQGKKSKKRHTRQANIGKEIYLRRP